MNSGSFQLHMLRADRQRLFDEHAQRAEIDYAAPVVRCISPMIQVLPRFRWRPEPPKFMMHAAKPVKTPIQRRILHQTGMSHKTSSASLKPPS